MDVLITLPDGETRIFGQCLVYFNGGAIIIEDEKGLVIAYAVGTWSGVRRLEK